MTKIAILYNDVAADSDDPGDRDVLTQCHEIAESLASLGHTPGLVACTLNLEAIRSQLSRVEPELVVNLVESLGGTDRMMPAVPMLLASMQLPYTGSSAEAILRSGDKLGAKRILAAVGIPTPAWFDRDAQQWTGASRANQSRSGTSIIVKAIHEHASFAMGNDAVTAYHSDELVEQHVRERNLETGRTHMAEQFIAGREFNLSILEIDGHPRVLSPAEIDFSELPESLPRIVGTAAKWAEDSIEYQCTPRKFDFSESDQPLVNTLRDLAIRCWDVFGLSGYARVDFRVDEDHMPYVLEVNTNPCLSKDAGFVAAAMQSGIGFDQMLAKILTSAEQKLYTPPNLTTKV